MQSHLANEVRKRDVQILEIRDLKEMSVSSCIIYQKGKTLSDNARAFLDILERRAESQEGRQSKRAHGAGRA